MGRWDDSPHHPPNRARNSPRSGGISMRISHPTAGRSGKRKESSLGGIESFQLLPVNPTTDVLQSEIGDLVTRLCLLQQPSVSQNPHTSTGMSFTDTDIPTSWARRACKFPVQMSTVETQQCSVSRMKPRRKRKRVTVGPSWHTSYYNVPSTNKHPIPDHECVR